MSLPGTFVGPSGVRARLSINITVRLAAERLPVSAGPPSGGRAALITLNFTRLPGLVQAMSKHLCWTHVIYRVILRPAAGSSGSHCIQ